MGAPRWTTPKKIRFPGGFIIRLQETELTDANAEWVVGESGGVLRYRKGLTKKQTMYFISHELVHAMIDYHHFLITEKGASQGGT